ncbi:MAG: efflux RND transporter permease subunit [Chlorobiaceae bacterium]|nr:efflux RND transporter permease subunit [Chlorobiaceae bacterium]NTW73542.1 efflux RND transporter permease subunit [Chlorobiaceae bacterium]
MSITGLAIKRPTLVVVLFSILGILGFFSYRQLQYELLPRMSTPYVTVTTVYSGASPDEIETSVTKQVEEAVSAIEKISAINSSSSEGLSMVTIEFASDADVDLALQDVQRKVNEARGRLPDGVKEPVVSRFSIDELPVLRLGATSSLSDTEFYQLLKNEVKPALSNISGVGQVGIQGGREREIRVNIDLDRLESLGMTVTDLLEGIRKSNLDFPTGAVDAGDRRYVVRLAGKFAALDELRNLVVRDSGPDGAVYLRDVAEVQDTFREIRTMSRINGRNAVGIVVMKQNDANTVEVSRLVRLKLAALESLYRSQGLKFDIAQDASTFTLDAVTAVQHDLFLAVLLVALVMLLFLHSLRNSVIVMISIPTSLVTTFIGMYLFGYSLNLMTLLALSLVIGVLVDDSIVVLENIYRHLERGEAPRDAALNGRNEIGFTALAITLVDVVVFLPLSLIGGLVGDILREFSVVMVISTMLSLFVSFTVTPLLASRFSKIEQLSPDNPGGRMAIAFEKAFSASRDWYLRLLGWSLRHPVRVVVSATLLLFSSFALVVSGRIGGEFIEVSDRGDFSAMLEFEPGTSLDQTNRFVRQVERKLQAYPEVDKILVTVGTSNEGFLGQSSDHVAEINVRLIPKEERRRSTDQIMRLVRRELTGVPGLRASINPIGIFGTANETPVTVIVSGPIRADVERVAHSLEDSLRTISGTADVRLSSQAGTPEMRVEIDREQMSAFGLSMADVGSVMRIAYDGDELNKFRERGEEYDIRLILDERYRSDTGGIADLSFRSPGSGLVRLGQFSRLELSRGYSLLQRRNRNDAVWVKAQVVDRPVGDIGRDIERVISGMKRKGIIPGNVSHVYEADLKRQGESNVSLLYAFLVAILFVYLIMVALYDSWIWPGVVMFSIPLAIIGALWALALFGKSLSIFTILGIIMLVGLVGKNAILLVDFINKFRQEGMELVPAISEAGRERLRPILMTTLTLIFGLMPIALSGSSGSEWKSGLAVALVGGLSSSMFLTLLVIPVLYVWFDRLQIKLKALPRLIGRMTGRGMRSNGPG